MSMSKRRRGYSGGSKTVRPGASRIPPSSVAQPATARRLRRSRRIVRHVDTASVFKFSAFFYLTIACIVFVAGIVLWLVATAVGVRGNVERFIGDLIASTKFHFVGWEVLKVAAVAAAVLVVLGTAFNLFLAVIYNLISEIVGGMAIIVDDEQIVAAPASPADAAPPPVPPLLPPSGIADIFTGPRAAEGSPVREPQGRQPARLPPAAAAPTSQSDGPRAIARWIPKRGRQV